jgi:crotonobetainyl-CoA:carnitine CoA-transferase CaiB-like acyl-CoA transferase
MSFAPLKGVRILDLTSVVVGPVCTARLSQYGADVIKVESPEGDLMRGLGGGSPTGDHSGTYLHLNRGKRNICCDLKQPGAKELIAKLVAGADVIVANMRPQALVRLGLDAQTIRAHAPEKIYCLISGFGTDGPYAGSPAYDSVIQAASGITGLTLARDGSPSYVPMLICDHVVGEIAAGAVLAAIIERNSTGQGCSIEVPMFETMAAFVLQEHLAQHSFDPPVGPPGDRRLLNPHNKPVQTADGWISLTVNTNAQVRAFLTAVGRTDLLDDPRFASVASRAAHVDEWFAIRGQPLTSRTTGEWLEILSRADIPVTACHTLESLPNDPHLRAVGILAHEIHPTEGATIAIRPTISFDAAYPASPEFAQPRGWETRAILQELGYSRAETDRLLAEDIVRSSNAQ